MDEVGEDTAIESPYLITNMGSSEATPTWPRAGTECPRATEKAPTFPTAPTLKTRKTTFDLTRWKQAAVQGI